MTELNEDTDELVSAEDFLEFFGVEYDVSVVQVNRLHILQRYHDYLRRAETSMPEENEARSALHQQLLTRAYQDFVESTPLKEKVFKVFKTAAGEGFVSLTDVGGVKS